METFHHHREPRTVEMTHAKRDDTIRPKTTLGGRIIKSRLDWLDVIISTVPMAQRRVATMVFLSTWRHSIGG